jgi:voltage-gated potassium channel Kch
MARSIPRIRKWLNCLSHFPHLNLLSNLSTEELRLLGCGAVEVVSEERVASIFRVERISERGTVSTVDLQRRHHDIANSELQSVSSVLGFWR